MEKELYSFIQIWWLLLLFFSSENIYTLLILFVTLEISFDERRGKSRWTWKRSKFLFSIKKGMEIFVVQYFCELKLYLLICSKRSLIWGLIPEYNQLLFSQCCLSFKAFTALHDATRGGRKMPEEVGRPRIHHQLLWIRDLSSQSLLAWASLGQFTLFKSDS